MILKLNLSLVSPPARVALRRLLQRELEVSLELEQLQLKFPRLKIMSLRQLRREARDLRKAVRTLERHIRKGGGS